MHNPSTHFNHATPVAFADILDGCITSLQACAKTVEECLMSYPDQRAELEPLLRLTLRLQAARTMRVSPAFRRVAATRMRNLIAAHPRQVRPDGVWGYGGVGEERGEGPHPRPLPRSTGEGGREAPPPPPIWQRGHRFPALLSGVLARISARGRYVRAVLALLVMAAIVLTVPLLAGVTAVYASHALPGQALYPLKRASESVRLFVSQSESGDARLHTRFAARRLDEIATLLQEGRPQGIEEAMSNYDAHLESALSRLGEDSKLPAEERVNLACLLVEDLPGHEAQLALLLDRVPEASQPSIALALRSSQAGLERARAVIADSGLGEELQVGPDLPVAVPSESPEPGPPAPTELATPTATALHTPMQDSTPALAATQTLTPERTSSPSSPTHTATPKRTRSPSPTFTLTLMATATATPVPPTWTATVTPLPPTWTATPVPPTSTPVPPTSTPVPTQFEWPKITLPPIPKITLPPMPKITWPPKPKITPPSWP